MLLIRLSLVANQLWLSLPASNQNLLQYSIADDYIHVIFSTVRGCLLYNIFVMISAQALTGVANRTAFWPRLQRGQNIAASKSYRILAQSKAIVMLWIICRVLGQEKRHAHDLIGSLPHTIVGRFGVWQFDWCLSHLYRASQRDSKLHCVHFRTFRDTGMIKPGNTVCYRQT